MPKKAYNQFYEAGQKAKSEGKTLADNPHPTGSWEARQWNGGWHNPSTSHIDAADIGPVSQYNIQHGRLSSGTPFDYVAVSPEKSYLVTRTGSGWKDYDWYRAKNGMYAAEWQHTGYTLTPTLDMEPLDRQLQDVAASANLIAAALPGTPRIAQGTAIDLYNGELIYVQSEDEVEGLYCLPEEEQKYLDQGMRRISVEEEAWWYRETPQSPEEVPQWYGPFEEREEAISEVHENIPDAEMSEIRRQRAASLQEITSIQAISNHLAEAETAQDEILGYLLGVPSGYEPKDDKQSIF